MGKRLYIFLSVENSIVLAFEAIPTESLFTDGVVQRIPAKCPPGEAPLGIFIVKSIFFLSLGFKMIVFSLTSIQLEILERSFLSAIGRKFGVPFSFNGLKSRISAVRFIVSGVSL